MKNLIHKSPFSLNRELQEFSTVPEDEGLDAYLEASQDIEEDSPRDFIGDLDAQKLKFSEFEQEEERTRDGLRLVSIVS